MSEVDLGSAYEAANRIADEWRALVVRRDAEIARLRARLSPSSYIDGLKDEIEQLREALRFYADRTHYVDPDVRAAEDPMAISWNSPVVTDEGKIARSAIHTPAGSLPEVDDER